VDFDSDGVRLNKYISDSGHCSRREADRLIESKRVKINGKLPELGSRVSAGDTVSIDDMEIFGSAPNKSDRIYLAYNKPIGITCTTERSVKGNIVDAIDHDERIFPIGRLDKPSDGLILLTNDGDIVNKILRAENAHDKEYLVTVNKSLDSSFASNMARGVPILGTKTKPCKVFIINKTTFKIVLNQGLNRQIRRMCEHFGYQVKSLTRLRIMNIQLGNLRPGQWRKLSKAELDELSQAVASSSSEGKQNTKRRRKPKPRTMGGYQGKERNFDPSKAGAKKAAKKQAGKSSGKKSHASNPRAAAKLGGKPRKPSRRK